jgi:hypothetical protein
MLAGGLEPDDWHSKSYLLAAERGWLAPSIVTSNGMTVTRDQITYRILWKIYFTYYKIVLGTAEKT